MVSFSKLAMAASLMASAVSASTAAASAYTDKLKDIKHIVFFMQENRAFDHYFGTMAGVRGFKDPNILLTDDKEIWYQPTASSDADYLLPWWLNEDPKYKESTECIIAGSNDWTPNHNSWNFGKINGWVTNNTAWSWGYLKRSDIPTHFSIVEGWTIGDMYQESVIGPTNPNRVTWVSGTININGSYPGDPEVNGGPYIENYETPGCETNGDIKYACYPLKWKTVAEYLEEQGITWFVYQDEDNFDDNPFAWFEQYQDADSGSALATKGVGYAGLEAFYEQAANGTLPQISWIIGPAELSEHPPYRPNDGAWLQQRVLDAITSSPLYNETALIVSYDETGGFGDHVPPVISPNGTVGEWSYDPEHPENFVPSGPGFRVPFYVVSPWTRGGKVFTEPSDHNSQLLFLEQWAKSIGKKFTVKEMNPWRRNHMSNLVNMFDFEHPILDIPAIANHSYPHIDAKGDYDGYSLCTEKYYPTLPFSRPPVPYGKQTKQAALWTESGYKQVRGQLTEGRFLVFQRGSGVHRYALAFNDKHKKLIYTSKYAHPENVDLELSDESQRFYVVQVGNEFSHNFYIKSASGYYLHYSGHFYKTQEEASIFTIAYDRQWGYLIMHEGQFLCTKTQSGVAGLCKDAQHFNIFSVSY
ncbi:phosphoesterase family-domain-containing protein [Lipomyces tetrasporus]